MSDKYLCSECGHIELWANTTDKHIEHDEWLPCCNNCGDTDLYDLDQLDTDIDKEEMYEHKNL